jgi:argininosuccinate lyase
MKAKIVDKGRMQPVDTSTHVCANCEFLQQERDILADALREAVGALRKVGYAYPFDRNYSLGEVARQTIAYIESKVSREWLEDGEQKPLENLLNKVQPDNMHGETDWGDPMGKEKW